MNARIANQLRVPEIRLRRHLNFLKYTTKNRLFLAIFFGLLTVVGLGSAACGDLLTAPNRGLLRVRTAGAASEVETYTARQIAAAIADDPVAYRSYMQLRNRVGADVVLDFGDPSVDALGRVRRIDEIEIFVRNNPTVRDAVSTFVHESRHISDLDRGIVNPLRPTVLDEYRAFRREFLFEHGRRPDSMERLNLWMRVRELYPHLPLE